MDTGSGKQTPAAAMLAVARIIITRGPHWESMMICFVERIQRGSNVKSSTNFNLQKQYLERSKAE